MVSGEDVRVTRFNPWWFSDSWRDTDPHLRRLAEQPAQFPARIVEEIDLVRRGVHTLRGPRQVGKSTDLKLLVERAQREGYAPRQVVYLALDLLEDQPVAAMSRLVERARELAGAGERCLLLLDEVTAVRGWQVVVKELWDRGVIDRDVVVCTGSSAVDLASGTAERLPGRRGHGRDHLVLPQAFDVFAAALVPGLTPSPRLVLGDLLTGDGRSVIRDAQVHGPDLERAMGAYLHFGGLPASVVEAATGARVPSESVQRVLWDSLAREVLRKGASEGATRALLERVVRSLGSKTSWSQMAREMDVPLGRRGAVPPDHRTLRDYVEFLALGYFVAVVYFWRADADSAAVSRQKKVYFADPLLHHIALEVCAPGLPFDTAAAVENAFAVALCRRYEPVAMQMKGFAEPSSVHVWETATGTEVDFVCGTRGALEALEVKFRARVDRRQLTGLRRTLPGRPVVMATRNELDLADDYALVPAHLLLWALG